GDRLGSIRSVARPTLWLGEISLVNAVGQEYARPLPPSVGETCPASRQERTSSPRLRRAETSCRLTPVTFLNHEHCRRIPVAVLPFRQPPAPASPKRNHVSRRPTRHGRAQRRRIGGRAVPRLELEQESRHLAPPPSG